MDTRSELFVVSVARSGSKVKITASHDFALAQDDFGDPPFVDGVLNLTVGSKKQHKVVDGGYGDTHQSLSTTVTLAPGVFIAGSAGAGDNVAGVKGSTLFNVGYFTKATTYNGTSIANYVLGSAYNDKMSGGGGNDCFAGGGGNDKLDGGSGNDTLYGGSGTNILLGGTGNDFLISSSGTDHLEGGTGNDTYAFSNPACVLRDIGGNDTIEVAFAYTLQRGYENLTLTGAKWVAGTGNASRNIMTGNDGNNTLNGLAGNDDLSGGLGKDTLIGGAGDDKLYGVALGKSFYDLGLDVLLGGDGNDYLEDGKVLNGGAGDDVLRVGLYREATLTGGAGKDTFDFDGNYSSAVITDFAAGSDKVDLRSIDANDNNGLSPDDPFSDDPFTFIDTQAFSGVEGELRYFQVDNPGTADDRTVVEGDTDGDGVANFHIDLKGLKTLTAGDFAL